MKSQGASASFFYSQKLAGVKQEPDNERRMDELARKYVETHDKKIIGRAVRIGP
jgi:hypothetical protein